MGSAERSNPRRGVWLRLLLIAACLAAAAGAADSTAADPPLKLRLPDVGGWGAAASEPVVAKDRLLVRFKSSRAGAAAAARQVQNPVVEGLRLVRFSGKHHRQAVPTAGAAAAAAGGPLAGIPSDATMVFKITDGGDMQDKLRQLRAHADVAVAEPDYGYRLARTPNDALYAAASRYSGMWFLNSISAPAAWDVTTGDPAVKVCVIDSGVRTTHEDLAANVAGGWNSIHHPTKQYLLRHSACCADTDGHGSHCAGSIGAVGGNALGITGVSWRVSLWICKALSPPDANGNSYLYASATNDCYALCNSVGAKVVSASYGGGGFSTVERDAINALGLNGSVFVAAAGNDATDNNATPLGNGAMKPSCRRSAVAASLPSDDLASFSNWGSSSVHLAAPGVNIRSTVPWSDSSYDYYSGTSMATPLTAGAVALLFAAKPNATVAEIKNALLSSVDPVSGKVISGGRLNVQRALAALLGNPLPATPTRTYILTPELSTIYSVNFGWATWNLFNSTTCLSSCQASSWCYYATAYQYTKVISIWDSAAGAYVPYYYGNCLWADASAQPTALVAAGTAPATCSYNRNNAAVFRLFANASVSGAMFVSSCAYTSGDPVVSVISAPAVNGPFTCVAGQDDGFCNRVEALAFNLSITISPSTYYWISPGSFVSVGTAPVTCTYNRLNAAVFRLYVNASMAGAVLTATSCGTFTGDSVVSVVTSTGPSSGFTCAGGNDDSSCGGTNSVAFTFSLTLTANTYVWISAAGYSETNLPTFQLSLSGASFVTAGTAPANCGYVKAIAAVFRFYANASVSGTMTATSCGYTTGDSVVAVISAPSLAGPYSCSISGDDSACGSPFSVSITIAPSTYYWISVSAYSNTATLTTRLSLEPHAASATPAAFAFPAPAAVAAQSTSAVSFPTPAEPAALSLPASAALTIPAKPASAT
ncbi:hypothetical protein ABPG75_004600 [Micractinium tetrahymenae]